VARLYANRDPSSPAAARVVERIAAFVSEHAQ
jgi:hypothetical protein